jgi:hypothetical protein
VEQVWVALIATAGTALTGWLVFVRGKGKDRADATFALRKEQRDALREANEAWVQISAHLEERLDKAERSLDAIRAELVVCQGETRAARNLASSLEDELLGLRRRLDALNHGGAG